MADNDASILPEGSSALVWTGDDWELRMPHFEPSDEIEPEEIMLAGIFIKLRRDEKFVLHLLKFADDAISDTDLSTN